MNTYHPLLNVYIIWHPAADALCRPLAKAVYIGLNRDPNRPFGRGIGIPTYYRCVAEPGKEIPLAIDVNSAVHSVVFVLVEDHLVNDDAWADDIAGLYAQTKASHGQHLLVPVALSKSAFNLHPDVAETNFVRLSNLDVDAVKAKLLHYILHILARLLANPVRTTEQGIELSPLPIKLFISHTKREPKALQLAEALKQELDNTQVGRFFDSVDIASGQNFADDIEDNIKDAALMAIRSDRYSDSPWCRMEVMAAKRLNRPMIVIDALQQHEDRSFPYLSNVPGIRFDLEQPLATPEARQKLHAIIDFALLEVLRFVYVEKHFAHLKACDWLPQDVFILSRPPEERDLRTSKLQHVVYPDPPLGYEENSELTPQYSP